MKRQLKTEGRDLFNLEVLNILSLFDVLDILNAIIVLNIYSLLIVLKVLNNLNILHYISFSGEELSRQMRQCQVNMQLANQQNDMTRSAELREEMQKLNQQQAKIHFSMHELITKERKLDAGVNKMMQNGHVPTMSMVNTQSHQMMDLSDQGNQGYYNNNENTNDDPTLTSPTQLVSFVASQPTSLSPLNSVLPPQSVVLSPEGSATQVHVDSDGRVVQFGNQSETPNDVMIINNDEMTSSPQNMTSSQHLPPMENGGNHAYISM